MHVAMLHVVVHELPKASKNMVTHDNAILYI